MPGHQHHRMAQPQDACPCQAALAHVLAIGGEAGHLGRGRRRGCPDQLADLVQQVETIFRRVAGDALRLRRRHHGRKQGQGARQDERQKHAAKPNEASDAVHARRYRTDRVSVLWGGHENGFMPVAPVRQPQLFGVTGHVRSRNSARRRGATGWDPLAKSAPVLFVRQCLDRLPRPVLPDQVGQDPSDDRANLRWVKLLQDRVGDVG